EWFIQGTVPVQTDTYYQQVWIDALTNSLATPLTPAARRKSVIALNLPAEAQPWARAQGLPLLVDLRQSAAAQTPDDLMLVSPAPNTTYRITPDLNLSAQQLSVEALGGGTFSTMTIYADGKALAVFSNPPYQAWWRLSAGAHSFWAEGTTPSGASVQSERVLITVLP
ncbi:MAG TPA: hypothetical protein VLZ89_01900, partial [Anaerolineales bacterium]|nr:hypothetical protein [Anaerolineales bacterium]